MAEQSTPTTATSSWRKDYRFLTLAGLILLVLGFNVFEHLLLDTDDADLRYHRLVIDGSRINNPAPGDVYVYEHQDRTFVPSKVCELQIFGSDLGREDVSLSARNVWGDIINATVSSVTPVLGETVVSVVKVDRPVSEWDLVKHHRPKINAEMNPLCQETVMAIVRDTTRTPFIVDTVYETGSDGAAPKKWVGFAPPIMLPQDKCPECPAPIAMRQVVKADPFTRLKVDWNIVRVE